MQIPTPLAALLACALLSGCNTPDHPTEGAGSPVALSTDTRPGKPPARPETPPKKPGATEPLSGISCRKEIGEQAAARLVDNCRFLSAATHPPCNAENSCDMIRSEIRRSCENLPPNMQIPMQCSGI